MQAKGSSKKGYLAGDAESNFRFRCYRTPRPWNEGVYCVGHSCTFASALRQEVQQHRVEQRGILQESEVAHARQYQFAGAEYE